MPIDIIESIDELGSVPCDEQSHHRVTLTDVVDFEDGSCICTYMHA